MEIPQGIEKEIVKGYLVSEEEISHHDNSTDKLASNERIVDSEEYAHSYFKGMYEAYKNVVKLLSIDVDAPHKNAQFQLFTSLPAACNIDAIKEELAATIYKHNGEVTCFVSEKESVQR